jgi:hypothetical protein
MVGSKAESRVPDPMSDSGSTVGAAVRAQLRSGAVSMALPRLVTWANTAHQGLREAARRVVVLDVIGSNPGIDPSASSQLRVTWTLCQAH